MEEPRTSIPGAHPGDPALWPGDATWHPVSPRLLLQRRLGIAAGVIPVGTAAALVAALTDLRWLAVAILAVGVLALTWSWLIMTRAVRAWGYAEREDDLLIRHGVLIRRLTVVPYGRMQFVDVRVGPVERVLGIATVQLHTAAAASDAVIPGLPTAEAARLRDQLATLGQSRAAGL